MIHLRRADERRHTVRDRRDVWSTFSPRDPADRLAGLFGALELLDESFLRPGGSVAPQRDDGAQDDGAEILTYVRDGALAGRKSRGKSVVTSAGEFERMTTAHGGRDRDVNPSPNGWAHVFQIRLRPAKNGDARGRERKRFTTAQRHNRPCVVASRDERGGSLGICQDAVILSSILDRGHHLIHELAPGRRAWLHIVRGTGTLQDLDLATGDGAGLTAERAVSFTAQQDTEILLVDVGEPSLTLLGNGYPE